jgi:hypothetical protein
MTNHENQDFLKFIGISVLVLFLLYVGVKIFKLQFKVMEGLTGQTSDTGTSSNGEAGSAAAYSANIKAAVVQMQDALLIGKYRADYENILLNLDDYINLLMLKTSLNINLNIEPEAGKPNPNMANFAALSSLITSKTSLNSVMKYIDSH